MTCIIYQPNNVFLTGEEAAFGKLNHFRAMKVMSELACKLKLFNAREKMRTCYNTRLWRMKTM